jgi:hypothetical protein
VFFLLPNSNCRIRFPLRFVQPPTNSAANEFPLSVPSEPRYLTQQTGFRFDKFTPNATADTQDSKPDLETREFARRSHCLVRHVPDVHAHSRLQTAYECVNFRPLAFDNNLDAAIPKVADKTGHVVALGDAPSCVPKPNALNVAGVE